MFPSDLMDLGLAANYEEPSTAEELALLVDYLFAHRKHHVQSFLGEHGIPRTGTKLQLRERLQQSRNDGHFRVLDLITLLDRIEGWGNQHCYLFRAADSRAASWRKQSTVEKTLRENRCIGLLNKRRPLLLPERPTLSSISWSEQRVRLLWVERREWEERLADQDFSRDGVLFKAHRPALERGITSFDWDLVSGHAALMIQRLPSGTRYDTIRDRYLKELEPLVAISTFELVRASRGIGRIEASGEARSRQLAHETRRGSRATFTSRGRKRDAFTDDPDLNASRAALRDTAAVLGNFYWQPMGDKLKREVHLKLYAQDQRVGVFGELNEVEVRYVLSRIRHHCR